MRSWLLVEWIQKDILCASFDVVNAKCLEGNKQDVCVGKLSILREKYSNNTRPGKVLYMSEDKQFLKNMKSMLMRMAEQMKVTVEMFNSTINQMKTELMTDCERKSSKDKSRIANGNYSSNLKKRKKKSTLDKDSQTVQQYSPEFINELRTSLKTGYEELTTIMFALKEDNMHRNSESVSKNNMSESSKRSKRGTEDDLTANAGPIKKKIRAWNELHDTDISKEKTKPQKILNSNNSMRQYINRKVLSPIHLNELIPENIDKVNTNDSIDSKNLTCAEDKENTVVTQPDNNNVYNFSDNHESIQDLTTTSKEDMIAIGSGNTLISRRVYDSLNWNSYTSVTRKLLQLLFSREVLSTHSLSGKQSPAFSNRPAKKQLNPVTVDDIVATVSQKCDIKESFVRTCITVKCADEAKMLRQRKSRNSIKTEESIHDVQNNSICTKE